MLDLRYILDNPEEATARLRKRDPSATFDRVFELDGERRAVLTQHNELRHAQKELSKGMGSGDKEAQAALRERLKGMSTEVKDLEARLKVIEEQLSEVMLTTPNLPQPVVPEGRSEEDNVVLRTWGEPAEHAFDAVDHVALGEKLGILDFEAAARLSGSGFALYRGLGARLERSLQSFMLDLHTEQHGYTEVLTPFIVRRDAMMGTGQLPKFGDDAYRIEPDDLFLIPTAEVPVTNMWREQILDASQVPARFCAFSPCFRREAGSYGRDVKGLTRVHQFQKVELVHFATPEGSQEAHEQLVSHAENVLKALGLAYRVVDLCGGDLGFGASRCYDIEVWLPVQKRWREISSCSNFLDFQARRADIRYRPGPGEKPRYVHTLNGSGLAIGRTVMAILEVYQNADGTVTVPEALRPYMRTDVIG
ncbi:MAG: serine--tRNA ligase [Deltaproteobacteria bacterium]|nr:serine--tRNA ligase [Deltaproteobacteria bacterium]